MIMNANVIKMSKRNCEIYAKFHEGKNVLKQ